MDRFCLPQTNTGAEMAVVQCPGQPSRPVRVGVAEHQLPSLPPVTKALSFVPNLSIQDIGGTPIQRLYPKQAENKEPPPPNPVRSVAHVVAPGRCLSEKRKIQSLPGASFHKEEGRKNTGGETPPCSRLLYQQNSPLIMASLPYANSATSGKSFIGEG
jgi:hypothetical protein